jgi:hypothetical protein
MAVSPTFEMIPIPNPNLLADVTNMIEQKKRLMDGEARIWDEKNRVNS